MDTTTMPINDYWVLSDLVNILVRSAREYDPVYMKSAPGGRLEIMYINFELNGKIELASYVEINAPQKWAYFYRNPLSPDLQQAFYGLAEHLRQDGYEVKGDRHFTRHTHSTK